MKNGTRIMKRVFSLVLALLMVFSMMPQITLGAFAASTDTTLYLKPNSNWTQSNAWFALYTWGGSAGEKWAKMTDSDGDGKYEGTLPAGYTNVIFCRMNPSKTALSWDSKWDQTKDLTFDGTKNLFTVASGAWNNASGTWSEYTPPVEETEAPTQAPTTAPTTAATEAPEVTQPAVNNVTVYCINSAKWDAVSAYAFGTNNDYPVAWPGAAMTKTGETVNGFDVYSATFDAKYVNVVFNNNNNGSQTADLTVQAGQYYDVKSGAWYASLSDVPAVDTSSTDVYLVGEFNGWSTVSNEFKKASEDAATAAVTMDLKANTAYEFKIIKSGEWTSNSTAITGDVTGLNFSSSVSGNAKITTAEAGTYTFVYTLASDTLAVTYPKAVEEPVYYNVTFVDGDPTYTNETVEAGGTATKPEDPVKDGYTFGGWFTDETYENEYDFSTPVTGDVTLYAKWTEATPEPEETQPEETGMMVYFMPGDQWGSDSARYAAYLFNDAGNVWVDLTDSDGDGYYEAEIPSGYSKIIFCRMSGTEKENNWDNKWNQTTDQTIPEGSNCFTMSNETQWAETGATGTWSVYTPSTGEEEEPGEIVSYAATFHFANTLGWSTVNLYTWSEGNSELTGGWPGSATKLEDGYYTATVEFTAPAGQGMNFIFNNVSTQTVDLTLPADAFQLDGEVYKAEKWVVLTTQENGKYNAAIVDSAEAIVPSPVVDGNAVTFNYGDNSAKSVSVTGSFNDWAMIEMTKGEDGVWTATVENLESGDYQYKFVVDGEWILDPMNSNVVTNGNDKNSAFYILSSEDTEDDNTITINVHYTRNDGNYDGWNLWVWGSALGGHQVDFESTDENGAMVATIELKNAREHQSISFKERLSVVGNEWKEEASSERTIDLSTIVSGTIDYYIPECRCVYGDDIIRKNKIKSVELDYDNGVINVTSVQAIPNAESALKLIKTVGEETVDVKATITVVGSKYSLTLPEGMEVNLAELYLYQVDYYGNLYSVAIDAAYASKKFADEFTYTGTDLGAVISGNTTTFKVWAPTAAAVSVNLYTSGTKGTDDLKDSIPMTGGTKADKGVWTLTVNENLNGTYYTYLVNVDGEDVEAVDPYARTTGVNGDRGMVIDLDSTDPSGWASDKNPNKFSSYTDAVIYELHVRDFSIDDSSGMINKGKYLAFTEEGTKTSGGVTTGVDYLEELGITHLHLLPVYDYGSVEETELDTPQFNWGYDPVNYNVPEGSYSTDPYNGAVRVKEFKQMVQSLHNNGISVIMDVVYNHVYNADKFCFNNIVPGYFSRVDSNISGCGNDTASEREMVRKYIVESVLYWHKEYHIDGFRFDLVGLLDVGTINQIVEEVHACCPDVIFYGEGWDMDATNKEPGTEMAKQGNAPKTPGFAYFSDSIRDLLAGSARYPALGYVSGKTGQEGEIVNNFMAKPWWTSNPTQVIQYASCHDNYTLVDRMIESGVANSATDPKIIAMNNLAATIYMTAQGVPFIHAGEEMLREKVNENGGREHNSYNSSDYVNHIQWYDLEEETYQVNVEYYKGLIAFRKAHPALRMNTAALVKANVYNQAADANLVSFWIDGREISGESHDSIYVIFNANNAAKTVELPEGDWDVCINGKTAGTTTIETVSGTVSVAGISAMVLVQEESTEEPSSTKSDVALPGSFNNWNTGNFMATTDDKNVVTQTLSLPAGTYEFKIKNGDAWLGNGGTIVDTTTGSAPDGWDMSASEQANCKLQASGGAYTFKFNLSTGKLIVEYDPNGGEFGDPNEYYLFGYINGKDYAMGFETGDYKFDENGKLSVTFDADSYVMVKNGDSSKQFMADGYPGAVTSAILKDTSKHSPSTGKKWDKMLIPGGVEVTITMVMNDNDTITLSYEIENASNFADASGVQNGVTLHCWNWSFDAITENMKTIADQGYTAIQTSPIQVMKEATSSSTVGSHWWVYYQPVDFVITTDDGNALGTKADFEEMCAVAEQYGIKVIVDVVANHLGNKTGNDLADAVPEYLRKDEYWHDITTNISNWNDRYNMTQYCLSGLPDLNTANKELQGYVLKFLKECVDAGADGFRFDMAKSIETPKDDASFASDFWPTVVNGIQEYAGNDLYIYGEVLDDAAIAISAYTQYMSVTDNGWGNHMRTLVNGGTAGLVQGFYKSADPSNLVIWAESHDTYATDDKNQSSAGVTEANINRTWALVAARKDAMGLYLARPESNDQLLGVASVTGWANAEVKAVNEFHNAFVGKSETVGNSGNIAYVVRGTEGIVMVNVKGTTTDVNLTVAMDDGNYIDQVTGETFTVADGKISGKIGETGIAVVYGTEKASTVAKIGDEAYDTVTEAIAAAEADETVVLVADAEEPGLVLLEGITLDLNGHALTLEYLAAHQGNNVIDSVGGGLLKAPRGFVSLQKGNSHLPIWDAANEGYAFADCDNFEDLKTSGTNTVKYTFLPHLSEAEYEMIAQGAAVSGVTMKVMVSWTSANGMPAERGFVYTDDLMQQFVQYYASENRKAFTLKLTGTDAVTDLAFRVCFVSDRGVEYSCNVG